MRLSIILPLVPLTLAQSTTTASLITTAAHLAQNLKLSLPNPSIALVPQPYYWWQSGLVTNALFTYGLVTGDTTYSDLASNTLFSQATGNADFMMPDATGNDNQAWWALAALTAAENGVAVPNGSPTFLSMAQNVFAEQKGRWDEGTCGGGIRFKINAGDKGYNYKSSIANGLFFQLAARLAKFTGDAEALAWAEKSWAWVEAVGLVDASYNVYDGADAASGCVAPNENQWSYNAGAFLYGAAVMASQTGDEMWVARTQGLLGAAQRNFVREDGELYEPICEDQGTCNNDQVSFKGILARWLGATAVEMADTQATIATVLDGVSSRVQSSSSADLGTMQIFVALESVSAAVRANGGVAAAYGMIGSDVGKKVKRETTRRSIAGRIVWDA